MQSQLNKLAIRLPTELNKQANTRSQKRLIYLKDKGMLEGFGNQMTNTCWNCKHDTLKLKVLVPHDRTIKEYVHRTGNFQSDIVAVVKEKQGQYTVWFRSEGGIKLVTFNMLHVCALRIERTKKQVTCPCFKGKEEINLVSNIIYSKQPTPKVIETELVH